MPASFFEIYAPPLVFATLTEDLFVLIISFTSSPFFSDLFRSWLFVPLLELCVRPRFFVQSVISRCIVLFLGFPCLQISSIFFVVFLVSKDGSLYYLFTSLLLPFLRPFLSVPLPPRKSSFSILFAAYLSLSFEERLLFFVVFLFLGHCLAVSPRYSRFLVSRASSSFLFTFPGTSSRFSPLYCFTFQRKISSFYYLSSLIRLLSVSSPALSSLLSSRLAIFTFFLLVERFESRPFQVLSSVLFFLEERLISSFPPLILSPFLRSLSRFSLSYSTIDQLSSTLSVFSKISHSLSLSLSLSPDFLDSVRCISSVGGWLVLFSFLVILTRSKGTPNWAFPESETGTIDQRSYELPAGALNGYL